MIPLIKREVSENSVYPLYPPQRVNFRCSAGHHGKSYISCRLQTARAQAQQEHGFCVKKKCVCGKDGLDAKTLVLFKPRFKFKPKHVCKPGFWKRPYWFGKGHIWKAYACKRCSAQKAVDQVLASIGYKKRWSKPMANTTKRRETTIEMTVRCAKLSRC